MSFVVHTPVFRTMSAHLHSDTFVWDGDGWIIRATTTDLRLTGCDSNGNAVSGQEFVIFNEGEIAVTLGHDDDASNAGMRLMFSDGQDHALDPGEQVWGVRWEGLTARPDGYYIQF
jgi:hypothetical protein